MASIYDLKPKFQNFLRPLVNWLAAHHVTANQVTLAALYLSLAHGTWIFFSHGKPHMLFWALLLLPLTLFIRMALNAVDGMLAREHDQKSQSGAVLNEMGDVIADVALYLPLAMVPGLPALPIILLVIIGLITEMAGVLAQALTNVRRYEGPMGKSDRAALFGTTAFFSSFGWLEAFWPYLLWAGCLAGIVSLYRRAHLASVKAPKE